MTISGVDLIRHDLNNPSYFVKCILTADVAVFFPGSIQHRDVKQNGASYEDDYHGNAMAATLSPRGVEIRYHRDYSDEAVKTICRTLLSHPDMAWASCLPVTYQGRPV